MTIVFKMSEAAVQAGVVGTILGVGDEASGRVTTRPEILGQRREAGPKRSLPVDVRAHGASGR